MDENIITKIEVDGLTTDKVSISQQKYIRLDEIEYPIETPYRTAFENSIKGREELLDKVKEPYLSAVLSVWGTEPTIEIK
ncbi:hypothetical protein M9Y10_037229 [Tritrichomonas musculus]|uniref:Uncharacterized protein n=1 Tax=Tritrichomonas musculus TaxID=1915356 RepID=A0ABR2GJA5_9EUKA